MALSPIEIHGYAIVSDDDMIAAADGLVPAIMRNATDWELYQRSQANSALVVFARHSHELEPNTRGDLRLIVSRSGSGLERREDGWWWDPNRISWARVVETILPQGGEIAAGGGQGVFDLFLEIGYTAFHLTRAHGVKLPGGRPIFTACTAGPHAEQVLEEAGLEFAEFLPLDPAQGVDMQIWRATRSA